MFDVAYHRCYGGPCPEAFPGLFLLVTGPVLRVRVRNGDLGPVDLFFVPEALSVMAVAAIWPAAMARTLWLWARVSPRVLPSWGLLRCR